VRFFTSAARPLVRLDELTTPSVQVATASMGLGRGIQALLRAGGVKLPRDAYSLARLTGPNHFARLFRDQPKLRLLVARATPAAAEAIVRGGGRPLVFQTDRGPAPATAARPAGPDSATPAAITSFGPIAAAALADTAKLRMFEPMNVQITERKPRPGHRLLVVRIDRDFGAGLGTISFLFGSGFILEPDFTPLLATSSAGRHPLVGTYADGPRLELVYEVPRAARQLTLVEGDARWPLDRWLGVQATN
jgi:hypothetical protein